MPADDPASLPRFQPPESSLTRWGYAELRLDPALQDLARALRRGDHFTPEAAGTLRRASQGRERPQDFLPLATQCVVNGRWYHLGRLPLLAPGVPAGTAGPAPEPLRRSLFWLLQGYPARAEAALDDPSVGAERPGLMAALRGVARADQGRAGALVDLAAALGAPPPEAGQAWHDQVELELVRVQLSLGLLAEGRARLEHLEHRLGARPAPGDPLRRRAAAQERIRLELLSGHPDRAATGLDHLELRPGDPGTQGLDLQAAALAVAVAVAQGRRAHLARWLESRREWRPQLLRQTRPRQDPVDPEPHWSREDIPDPGDELELLAARALARLALGDPDPQDREVLVQAAQGRALSCRLARELGWLPGDATPLADLARRLPRPARSPRPAPTALEPVLAALGRRPLTGDEVRDLFTGLDLRSAPGAPLDPASGLPTCARDAAGYELLLVTNAPGGRGPAYVTRAPWTWERFLAAGGEPAEEQAVHCLRPGPACALAETQLRDVLPAGWRVPTRAELAPLPPEVAAGALVAEELALPVAAWRDRYGPAGRARWRPGIRQLHPVLPLAPALELRLGRRTRRSRRLGRPRLDLRGRPRRGPGILAPCVKTWRAASSWARATSPSTQPTPSSTPPTRR